MITCSVCGIVNSELDTICVSCKSFLQARVDALNLFETIWGLIESPRATLRKIVLARHKNYAVVLGLVSGLTVFFDIAWMKQLGDRFGELVSLVGMGIVLGPILGVVALALVSLMLRLLSKFWRGKATKKNMFAATAYAFVPLAIAAVFVIPLELATFGIDFFGTNPPPALIKPLEYYLILGLKSVLWIWMAFLLIEAMMAANAFESKRRLPVASCVLGVMGILITAIRFA
ncbi:MAG: YIP1 family protein [Ignavibacteriae bacterium]|nr:YIP1 family protein [Ignavibacteriota bacterium]